MIISEVFNEENKDFAFKGSVDFSTAIIEPRI
jgi:hypothetical protein